jgi:hypothetical protein
VKTRSSRALPVVLLALAVGLAAFAATARAAAPDRVYVQQIVLKGKNEKPHGELDSSGTLTLCLNKSRNVISFNFDELTVNGQPTVGQIEKGAPGVSGPSAFRFGAPGLIDPSMGEVEWADTAPGAASLIAALIAKPSAYYVNVHTKMFRNGAIRGQLGKWKLMSVDAQGALECGVGT